MNDALLRLSLIVIAAITVISGATQLVAPGTVLGMIAPAHDAADAHLFRTVGMFMVITGAMFLQSLVTRSTEPAIPLWIAVQKFAAAVLVLVAWASGLFLAITLLVALFDAATGVLAFVFWRRMPR